MIQWRRGFFRIWVFVAVLWMLAAIAFNLQTVLNPVPYFPDTAFIFDGDSMDATRTSNYGAEFDDAAEKVRTGTFIGARFQEFDLRVYMFTAATNAGAIEEKQADLVREVVRRERAGKREELRWAAIANILWLSTLPAAILLTLGWVIAWIIGGFRAGKGQIR